MRDISEIPGGTEQAKPTNQRPKNSARSKPENQSTGNQAAGSQTTENQESEPRNTPRRRSPSSTQNNSTTQQQQQQQQQGNEQTQQHPRSTYNGPRHNNNSGYTQGGAQRSGGPSSGGRGSGPSSRGSYSGSHTGGPGAPSGSRYSGGPNTGGPGTPSGSRYNGGPSGPPSGSRYGGGPSGPPSGSRYGGGPSGPPSGSRYSGGPSTGPRGSAAAPGPAAPSRGGDRSRGTRGPNSPRSGNAPQRSTTQERDHDNASRSPRGGNRPNTQGGARPGQRHGNGPSRTQERRTAPVKEKVTGPIQLPPQIIVKDLADALDVTPIEVIRNLISKHATFASINQVIDYDKASLVAKDLGFEPSPLATTDTAVRNDRQLSASEAAVVARKDNNTIEVPPVVTIMGHVDHGKTSLLDMIRKTKVAAGEAGGITQHIGAYQVEVNGKKITFLDTPGHEAFTAMRARGAQVAQIAIIVIAADDGVMPQTREAIDHAQAAKMPIIIALNKIDRPNANPDHVKQQLAEIGILIEEYGGETVLVPVSAKKGEGIDELLEYILLVAEVQDIRADVNRRATGVIIEAKLEKNSGATATVLVQQGTLKMGDNIVVGPISGKIRAMFNDRGKRIQKALPSTPVSILGLPEVPNAGDQLEATADEKTARQVAQQEAEKRRDEAAPLGRVNLDTLYMQMQEGKVKELELILKSDVQGSSEAIKGALSKLSEENLKVRLIREGIGNISETDVHLAAASGAIIIGFNVKADGAAERETQRSGVDIRYYNVIYKLIEDIQAALHGMLEPTYREVIDGHAEILQIFKAGKSLIAGCRITDGKISRASQARILRNKEKVFDGKVASLRRGKDDVREVLTGYECGIVLEDFNTYEVGDIIEAYSQERVTPGA